MFKIFRGLKKKSDHPPGNTIPQAELSFVQILMHLIGLTACRSARTTEQGVETRNQSPQTSWDVNHTPSQRRLLWEEAIQPIAGSKKKKKVAAMPVECCTSSAAL
jgi:hypothetical protein